VPLARAFEVVARWVEAIKADRSHASLRTKVIRNRPADAVDGCYTAGTQPEFIAEPQTWSSLPDSQCNTLWPSYSAPRQVAGGPLAANILKCDLKAIDPGDYAVSFTPAELQRLQDIFPNGVCDWSRRGVNHVPLQVGRSFGPAPTNHDEYQDLLEGGGEH